MSEYCPKIWLAAFTLFLSLSTNCLYSQVAINKRSTLSQAGATSVPANRAFTIQQSIGQGSVVGSFQANSTLLSQGFIQPANASKKGIKKDTQTLKAEIYPNPVSSILSIEFYDEVTNSVDIELCNVLGKVVFKTQSSAEQIINLDLGHLTKGVYFLKINTENQHFSSKLLKE